MSAERIDVLAVMDAEISTINRIRHSLGKWLAKMEDSNWEVNGSGGPDDLTLSDLNDAVIRLRQARAAVAELVEAAKGMSDWWAAESSLPQVAALRVALARVGGAS